MSYTVIGAKELQAVFAGMPQLLEHKILQQGNADAAKLIVNAAKLMAPEGPTGNLVDSIGTIKPSFSASDAIGETHTGPRRGRFKGYAGHLVEFGTKKRNYRGANRGTMPKKPFMEPAFNKVKDQVIAQIETSIAKKLYAFMKRTLK
jgi:HK97 gp10 family phage protein